MWALSCLTEVKDSSHRDCLCTIENQTSTCLTHEARGGPRGDNAVHEVEELDAPPPLLVSRRHLAGGHLEGGEQRRGAVALVIVAMTAQRSAVRHFQIALCPLQCLDRGLFIDADDNRILPRCHV